MKIEVNPQETSRAEAFEMWMTSPMPMVTLTKTFDVTRLYRISKKLGIKFNTLLCWCIGKAATQIDEFYYLPDKGKFYKYDRLAINVIVNNAKGGINSCDVPFTPDLKAFAHSYNTLASQASQECKSSFLEDHIIVGTSAMIQTELDAIVNQYTDKFNNPLVMWGKYRKLGLLGSALLGRAFHSNTFLCKVFRSKVILPISLQFHHTQMDGGHAAGFLELLQREINAVGK